MQMLKRALIAYVNSMKAVWSAVAYPLSIPSKREGNVKDYRIYGNSIQDGTPTPENPIEVQSVGELVTEGEYTGKYKVPVTVRGKNLFNYEDSSNHTQGYLRQDNSYINDPKWKITNYIPVSGKNVCLSGIQSGSNPSVCAYDADKNFITGLKYQSKKNVVIKSDIEISFVRFSYSTSDSIVWDLSLVQLEKGTTATEYEPYIEPQAVDIYLDEPLRKVGDYADCVDFGKGVVVRNTAKKVFNGTETFTTYAKNFRYPTSGHISLDSNQVNCIGNLFEGKTWELLWANTKKENGSLTVGVARMGATTGMYIYCTPSETLPTVDEWKAQLKAWYEEGKPFTVWYVIEPIEQLINLPKLPQFKGTTIYEVNQAVPPSGIEVCYYE